MILDDRSLVSSYSLEILENGMKEIGKNSLGESEFLFYGSPAVIVTRTDKVLATLDEWLDFSLQIQNQVISGNVLVGEVLTSSSGAGSLVYIKGQNLYSGTLTYTIYPPLETFVPPPITYNYTTDANISGYTIRGEAIISYRGRDRKVTANYTDTFSGTPPYEAGTVGFFQGNNQEVLFTNVSISNYRVINGVTYADYSVSYTELTRGFIS